MRGINVAEYVIEFAGNQGKLITNLKLQKTLYYIQGYSFRKLSYPIIDDDFFNWQYGPVLPSVYFEYSGNSGMSLERRKWIALPRLAPKQSHVLNRVIEECLSRNVSELVELSHGEDPWKNTQLRDKISKKSIQVYFENNDPLTISF